MTRETSIEAYNKIKANGLLSTRRWQVYDTVFHCGPVTTGETWRLICHQNPNVQLNAISPRFAELRDMGVLQEVGERKCGVTKHAAITWDVTDQLPQPLSKKRRHEWADEAAIKIVDMAANPLAAFDLDGIARVIRACYANRRK